MLSSVVLLDLEEILLGVRADLNDVLGLDVLFNLLPVATVFLESVDKGLMLLAGPVFAILGDDVGLARFLGRDGVRDEGGGRPYGGGVEMRGDSQWVRRWQRKVLRMERRGDGRMSEGGCCDGVGARGYGASLEVGRKIVGAHV